MKDSGSQWGSHGTNQTSMGTLEHQLLFMWACPSSHQPLEITWREPPWGLEESQQPLILETAIIPVSGCMEQPKKKKKLHLLLDSYSGAQGWLLHVFCILQQDQVPSSQTKNLKLMNISCHGQCWMRYRHIHFWNSIWEMPERVEDSALHQRPGLYRTWFKFRWDRQLTLPDVHCFILSEMHCEGSFCAMICHFVNGWAWISCTVRWCVEVSHITNKWSDSPSQILSFILFTILC